MKQPLIFDGRNLFDPAKMKARTLSITAWVARFARKSVVNEHFYGLWPKLDGITYLDRPGVYAFLRNSSGHSRWCKLHLVIFTGRWNRPGQETHEAGARSARVSEEIGF